MSKVHLKVDYFKYYITPIITTLDIGLMYTVCSLVQTQKAVNYLCNSPKKYLSMHSNLLRMNTIRMSWFVCTTIYLRSQNTHIYKYIIYLSFQVNSILCAMQFRLDFSFRSPREVFYILRIHTHGIFILHLKRKFPEGQFLDKTSNLILCPSSKLMFVLHLKRVVNRYSQHCCA